MTNLNIIKRHYVHICYWWPFQLFFVFCIFIFFWRGLVNIKTQGNENTFGMIFILWLTSWNWKQLNETTFLQDFFFIVADRACNFTFSFPNGMISNPKILWFFYYYHCALFPCSMYLMTEKWTLRGLKILFVLSGKKGSFWILAAEKRYNINSKMDFAFLRIIVWA